MPSIDLNCDMAELPELAASGVQDALLAAVSSVNIACGAHAGNPALVEETIRAAARRGVAIGAHPGFPDPGNFGRLAMEIAPESLRQSLQEQLLLVAGIAAACGVPVRHVKPHGALYNQMARDNALAALFLDVLQTVFPGVPVMMLAGSSAIARMQTAGIAVIPEAFVDRAYEADGSLRNRHLPGALIMNPVLAAQQALMLACDAKVRSFGGESLPLHARTLCVHSDTPGAPGLALAVREALEAAGFRVQPAPP